MSLLLLALLPLALAETPSVDAVIEEVLRRDVEPLDGEELAGAALDGIAAYLEEHGGGRILSQEEYEAEQAALRGERRGVGIGVLLVPRYGVRVLEVFPGTPAERAGLQPGDVVVALWGKPLAFRSAEEIGRLLLARPDEDLVLDVLGRDGSPRRLRLERVRYTAAPVSRQRGEGYTLLRLHHLGPGSAEALARALESAGSGPVLLDLRDTGIGLVEEAVRCAGLFLPPGPVAELRDASGERHLLRAEGSRWEGRLVVLVNGGTRGVAELLAAALARARHPLVGARTAGVVELPTYLPLPDGRVLQVPGQRMSLAGGGDWSGGLEPQVEVEPFAARQLLPPPSPPPDLQLDAALKLVSNQDP